MSVEQRQQYERYLMNVASERDIMQTAHDEGVQIGFEKGQTDLILRLYRKGKSAAEIADLTDLPLDIVQEIIGERSV